MKDDNEAMKVSVFLWKLGDRNKTKPELFALTDIMKQHLIRKTMEDECLDGVEKDV